MGTIEEPSLFHSTQFKLLQLHFEAFWTSLVTWPRKKKSALLEVHHPHPISGILMPTPACTPVPELSPRRQAAELLHFLVPNINEVRIPQNLRLLLSQASKPHEGGIRQRCVCMTLKMVSFSPSLGTPLGAHMYVNDKPPSFYRMICGNKNIWGFSDASNGTPKKSNTDQA
jgi:hypothetical protein